ncbi:MAG: DUF4388 domain-containing protein [bacterium]|nr:DUF4388 domain-containing protein [bacterium]
MSLVGNIEDLGLGDILQIVSLSRKSGVLFLTSNDREGKLVFKDGQVVRAFSTDVGEDLEKLLLDSGLVDKAQLKEAMDASEGGVLDNVLVEKFGVDKDCLDEIRKEQIGKSAYTLFGWKSGNFNFDLRDVDEYIIESDFFVYPHGMNPQFIAMEGTRLQDEMGRDQPEAPPAVSGEPVIEEAVTEPVIEEATAEPSMPLVSEEPVLQELEADDLDKAGDTIKAFHEETIAERKSSEGPCDMEEISHKGLDKAVVIIDDDSNVLKALKKGLCSKGFNVIIQGNTEDALHHISELNSINARVVILSDLIMPRMDGTGMLGGIETLDILRGGFPDFPVILMTDHVNRDAEQKAKGLGVYSYIDKPKRGQFGAEYDSVAVDAFVENIAEDLTSIFDGPEKSDGSKGKSDLDGLFDLAADLQEEFAAVGEILPEEGSIGEAPISSPGISMLRAMIEELNSPEGGKQITLLTLRFASELMNRSVIFLVKPDAFEGLGQFGIDIEGASADMRVRSMKLGKYVPSILKDVLDTQRSIIKRMEDTEGNRYIIDNLGGKIPLESLAAPIIASGKVAVILYCDNIPEEKPIGDASALDIFLMQAGVAMERALLERKVQEMTNN